MKVKKAASTLVKAAFADEPFILFFIYIE